MTTLSRTRRTVAVATAAASLVGAAAAPANASDIQRAYAEHTSHCIGLFFSDKAAHTEECLPNLGVMPFSPTTSDNSPYVVAPPPPVVVVVAPPPVVVVPPVVVEPPRPPGEAGNVPSGGNSYPTFVPPDEAVGSIGDELDQQRFL